MLKGCKFTNNNAARNDSHVKVMPHVKDFKEFFSIMFLMFIVVDFMMFFRRKLPSIICLMTK